MLNDAGPHTSDGVVCAGERMCHMPRSIGRLVIEGKLQ